MLTVHAEEELADDDLTVYDLECILLTGEIVERQRDEKSGEFKYRVEGESVDGGVAETIVKKGALGKVIVITVYRKEGEAR